MLLVVSGRRGTRITARIHWLMKVMGGERGGGLLQWNADSLYEAGRTCEARWRGKRPDQAAGRDFILLTASLASLTEPRIVANRIFWLKEKPYLNRRFALLVAISG